MKSNFNIRRKKSATVQPADSKRKSRWLFFLVLFLQLLFAVFWCTQKSGYFVDELWSYGLANSYYKPYVYVGSPVEDGWVSGEYFGNYLTVDAEHRFDYGSVFYNQEMDTHPPLFYLILHTICSLFPGTFSKWYGLLPNLVCFLAVSVLVYLWAGKLFRKSRGFPLACMIFWSFSIAAMSCVVFLRMYMLLTLWFTASLYLHTCMIIDHRQSLRRLAALLALTFLGFFSHYYFAILGAFLSAGYVFWLLFHRYWKRLWQYVVTMLLSLGLAWLVFPDTFTKILGLDSNRGVQAYQNLRNTDTLLPRLGKFLEIINNELFAGFLPLFVLLTAIVFLVLKIFQVRRIRRKTVRKKVSGTKDFSARPGTAAVLAITAAVISLYTVLIALIAPYQADRYIFCIFPAVSVLFTAALFRLFSLLSWRADGGKAVWLLLLLLTAVQWLTGTTNYLYQYKKDNVAVSQAYADHDCLYITYDYNRYLPTNNLLELQNYHRVLTVKISGEDYTPIASALSQAAASPVVYLDNTMDTAAIIQFIRENGNCGAPTLLYQDDKITALCFEPAP